MRRIHIDNARRKQTEKHGDAWQRRELFEAELAVDSTPLQDSTEIAFERYT